MTPRPTGRATHKSRTPAIRRASSATCNEVWSLICLFILMGALPWSFDPLLQMVHQAGANSSLVLFSARCAIVGGVGWFYAQQVRIRAIHLSQPFGMPDSPVDVQPTCILKGLEDGGPGRKLL